MKNLHYLKKFVVMVLAAMMTLSTFALPTFAAEQNKSFEVKGLKENKVVATAYKIVSMDADDTTKVLVKKTDGTFAIADVDAPTQDEILAIAATDLDAVTPALTKVSGNIVADGDGYKAVFGSDAAPIEAGLYLVKFRAAEDASVIYNPVIVGINNDKGKDTWANLKVDDKFNNTGYVKSEEIKFDKVVDRDADKNGEEGTNPDNTNTAGDEASVNADGFEGDDGNRGDTAGKGDTVWFRINTQIPAYADNFFTYDQKPEFLIYDQMTAGLDLQPDSISVWVYNAETGKWEEVNKSLYNIPGTSIYVPANDKISAKGFNIEFKEDGIRALRGKKVEVRYSAVVNGDHGYNFDGEKNTAGFKYTRNPGEKCTQGEEKKTYHYTFTINGKVNGPDSDENREVIKVGILEGTGQFVYEETTVQTQDGWKPLKGATFKLYKANAAGTEADTSAVVRDNVVSDENGILRGMDRIDAGVYYLIEKDAPAGYASNDTQVKIEIKAWQDSFGRLTKYTVEVGGVLVGSYEKTYADDDEEGVNAADDSATVGTLSYTPSTNSAAQNGRKVQKYHKVAAEGEKYMDETGATKEAAGGELCYERNSNDEIVPVLVEMTDNQGQAIDLVNSKKGTLPSTGGMGTVLFTIAGAAIMGLALLLLFGGKKRHQQK